MLFSETRKKRFADLKNKLDALKSEIDELNNSLSRLPKEKRVNDSIFPPLLWDFGERERPIGFHFTSTDWLLLSWIKSYAEKKSYKQGCFYGHIITDPEEARECFQWTQEHPESNNLWGFIHTKAKPEYKYKFRIGSESCSEDREWFSEKVSSLHRDFEHQLNALCEDTVQRLNAVYQKFEEYTVMATETSLMALKEKRKILDAKKDEYNKVKLDMMKALYDGFDFLGRRDDIPSGSAGIYFIIEPLPSLCIVYIGQSQRIKTRLSSAHHVYSSSMKESHWIGVIFKESKRARLDLERELIERFRPMMNYDSLP